MDEQMIHPQVSKPSSSLPTVTSLVFPRSGSREAQDICPQHMLVEHFSATTLPGIKEDVGDQPLKMSLGTLPNSYLAKSDFVLVPV